MKGTDSKNTIQHFIDWLIDNKKVSNPTSLYLDMEDYAKELNQEQSLPVHSVSQQRELLIATIEKVRYNLDGYGALTSSQIAERLERNLIIDAMMFAVKDITGRVLREETVLSMVDDFEKERN